MDSEVDLLLSLGLLLLSHVHLVLVVHKLDDRSPAASEKSKGQSDQDMTDGRRESWEGTNLSRLLT